MSDLETHRMVHLPLPRDVQRAAWALCRHSKDIYNTTLNLLRQAHAVCEWDREHHVYRRRTALALNAREAAAMAIWDQEIDRLNTAWALSYQTAMNVWNQTPTHDKDEKPPKNLVLPILGSVIAKDDLSKILLNSSLLVAVVKASPDIMLEHDASTSIVDVETAYRTLPGKMAEASVFLAQKSFKSWLSNLKSWHQNRAKRGQPQMPNYLPRDAALVCSMSGSSVGTYLSSLDKCLLWLDADHFKPLTSKDRAAYAAFPIRAIAEHAIAQRWKGNKRPLGLTKPTWQDLATVEMVPKLDGRVSLRISVKVNIDYPETSFLGTLSRTLPEAWTEAKTPAKRQALIKTLIQQQSWRSSKNSSWSAVPFAKNESQEHVQDPIQKRTLDASWISEKFSAGGIDLGLGNLVTLSWTNGSDADVFDGKAMERSLDGFDRRIDTWISTHMTDEHKALVQAKFDWFENQKTLPEAQRKRFPLKLSRRLRTVAQSLHQRIPLLRIRAQRARWLRDKLHQLSAKVVKLAVAQGVAVLIIGQNKGWKEGINLRTRENRRFCRIPHAELIHLIGQKLEVVGIAMILTEESYTSQASFIDHDPLRQAVTDIVEGNDVQNQDQHVGEPGVVEQAFTKRKVHRRKKQASLVGKTDQEILDTHEASGSTIEGMPVRTDRHGYRDKKNRDRFIRQMPWASRACDERTKMRGPRVLNADVNGSFNMMRKVCPLFAWHPGISVRHTIWQMSWSDGLTVRPR